MKILESKQNIRSIEALFRRYQLDSAAEATARSNQGAEKVHRAVVDAVTDLMRYLTNMRMASRNLAAVGSRAFRKPRGVTHEDVILYHMVAAFHEAGAFKYRLLRLLGQVEKYLRKTKDGERLGILLKLRAGLNDVLSEIMNIRGGQVHDEPFMPHALRQYATWATMNRGKERLLGPSYAHTARVYSQMWRSLADELDEMALFYLDFIGLLFDPDASIEEFDKQFVWLKA